FNLLGTEANLRSKRELIEKFIKENLPVLEDAGAITDAFDQFWSNEQQKAFNALVSEEKLSPERTQALIENYLYADQKPLRDEVLELLEGEKPSVLLRKKTGERILQKILDFVETFINEMNFSQ
ncbi:MAG: type I restriction endonuclease subunit R, partial [Sphingobacteriales bacterium]